MTVPVTVGVSSGSTGRWFFSHGDIAGWESIECCVPTLFASHKLRRRPGQSRGQPIAGSQ
jgi:hypothetical protein